MELAFVNYINVISGLLAVILVPVTLMNIAIQFSSSMDRTRILQEYESWKKGYNYQIVICGAIGMYFLHPLMGALIFTNIVIWFTGNIYHSFTEQETNHV